MPVTFRTSKPRPNSTACSPNSCASSSRIAAMPGMDEQLAPATIAVVGAGAVGCYYGARLARAGHDVRFLMRRALEAVRPRGLDTRSKDGGLRLPPAHRVG